MRVELIDGPRTSDCAKTDDVLQSAKWMNKLGVGVAVGLWMLWMESKLPRLLPASAEEKSESAGLGKVTCEVKNRPTHVILHSLRKAQFVSLWGA